MNQSQGKPKLSTDWTTLKGKFFHTFDNDGYVKYQGVIINLVGVDIAIVQYFEWMVGAPSTIKAVWISDIVNDSWALYESGESMNEAYEYGHVKSRPSENS